MDYDAVLDEIGSFGKFQIKILLWISLPVLYGAANAVAYVFIARTPPYRCFVDQCEQFDSAKYSQDWLQYAVPGSISSGQFVPEGCYKYNFNDTGLIGNNTCVADLFGKQRQKCDSWIFDENEVTMITDWPSEMTCTENEWKLALIGTANFAGVMLGSAIFGFLADYYGRRTVFIGSLAFMSLTGIGQAVSNSYMMLLIFTLLNAAGTAGIYFAIFVLIIEMLHKSKREMSSVLLNYFFAIGGALVGIIAYYERNWRNLTLWIAAPPIIFVIDYWLIPESACWLIANKFYTKAYKIIQKAAKDNKKELSASIVSQFKGTNIDINISSDSLSQLSQSENRLKTSYVDILKSRKLVLRCLVLFFVWGTNSLVFYGLSLYSVSLSGNIYLNFMYVSLAEIPGITIAWYTMNKIGRRSPLILSFMACGICSIIGAFISEDLVWLQICVFLVSKMAISTSFTITSVYTAEMMPTNMRSGCVGTFSTVARLSSLLAPFIPLLKNLHNFLPLVVFGSFSLASGLMSMLLPETFGANLPDTVQEAEDIGT